MLVLERSLSFQGKQKGEKSGLFPEFRLEIVTNYIAYNNYCNNHATAATCNAPQVIPLRSIELNHEITGRVTTACTVEFIYTSLLVGSRHPPYKLDSGKRLSSRSLSFPHSLSSCVLSLIRPLNHGKDTAGQDDLINPKPMRPVLDMRSIMLAKMIS